MMKKTALIFSLVVFLAGINAVVGQSLEELTKAPKNTEDSRNLRIWMGLEKPIVSSIKLEILSLQYKPIRTLFNTSLGTGYYNFYWDKKDDSGNYVPEGRYTYRWNYLKDLKYGNLLVKYHSIGDKGILRVDTLSKKPKVFFELRRDSSLISLRVVDSKMEPVSGLIKDSLYNEGEHEYIWKPDKAVRPGNYFFILEMDGLKDIVKAAYKK